MGRRPETDDNNVSLFPFLSILACVIGVLTLMISALALMQMDDDVVARAEEYDATIAELERQRSSYSERERQLHERREALDSQLSFKQKKLLAHQEEIKLIQNQYSLATKKRDAMEQVSEQGEVPEQEPLADLEKEWGGLKEQIAQLTRSLKKRKDPPKEAEVTVVPGGSGRGIKPFFIECTKNGIVLHQTTKPVMIRPGNIEKSPPYLELLDRVAGTEKAKIIFLIRSDGVPTWWRAKSLAESLEVPHGKLPVLGQGNLNLEQVQVD
ncbi:MAG: hypothetical protein MK106_14925 [Mariniblastus sp.]|nr:hypothetical protein [Mariniblastus sp.]